MALTFILLLVTAVSFIGLVSLWAAKSHHHWFWRAAALTVLWMLLAPLRSEAPLALFAIQSLTIVAPIVAFQAWQSRRRRRVAESSPDASMARESRWRFSIRDVLLATPILAGFASTYPSLTAAKEEIDHVPWEFAVVGGIVFGLMTLLARTATLSWRRLVVGLLIVLPISGAISYGFEQFDPGVLDYVLELGLEHEVVTEDWQVWMGVICGVWWGAIANQYVLIRSSRYGDVPWRRGIAVWVIVLSLLPAYVYFRLITPPEIPQVALPQPNGFDDLVTAGKGLDVRLINFASESPVDQVVAELTRLDEYFVLAEQGLNRPCQPPVDYTGLSTNDYSACRTLARAFSAKIRAAIAQDRVDDAVRDIESAFRLGLACRTGGTGIDYLVGAALEGIATSDLWEARQSLNSAQCVMLIDLLNRHAAAAEPIAVVLERRRIQTQYAYGFYGQLQTVLADIGGETWLVTRLRTVIEPRYRTTIELLKCELAICAYQLEHGRLPPSLDSLVPGLLPYVPIDPFDPAGGPLRYQLADEAYVLYSVGLNGVDEGGISIVDEEEGIPSPRGDFRLDAVFGDGGN